MMMKTKEVAHKHQARIGSHRAIQRDLEKLESSSDSSEESTSAGGQSASPRNVGQVCAKMIAEEENAPFILGSFETTRMANQAANSLQSTPCSVGSIESFAAAISPRWAN